MSNYFDAEDAEPEIQYPTAYMNEWAGNIVLISDALVRIPTPVVKENFPQYKHHVKTLISVLEKAVKLHNACVEMELLLAVSKLRSAGVPEEAITTLQRKFNGGIADENNLSVISK